MAAPEPLQTCQPKSSAPTRLPWAELLCVRTSFRRSLGACYGACMSRNLSLSLLLALGCRHAEASLVVPGERGVMNEPAPDQPGQPQFELWPAKGWIVTDFGWTLDRLTGQRVLHEGLDFAMPEGTVVVAQGAGSVVSTAVDSKLENMLTIDYGHGLRVRLGCLSAFDVKAGDAVVQGQPVGRTGKCNGSEGSNLHYEVDVGGSPRNPRSFTKQL